MYGNMLEIVEKVYNLQKPALRIMLNLGKRMINIDGNGIS